MDSYIYEAILKDAKELLAPDDYSKFVAALKDAEARFAKGIKVEVPVGLGEPPYTGIYGDIWDFMSEHGGWFIQILKTGIPDRMVVDVTVKDIVATDTCVWEGKTDAAQKKLSALRALRIKHERLFYCSPCSNIHDTRRFSKEAC